MRRLKPRSDLNLIAKIAQNRLKAVSVLAIIGDVFMLLSGGEGLVTREPAFAFAYSLILFSSVSALVGHLVLFLWGKGARDESIAHGVHHAEASFLMKPFLPWRYPLDSALFIWLLAGLSYTASGIVKADPALLFMGLTHVAACSIGWLFPKEKTLFGFKGIQLTSILYLLSTVCTFWAAWTLGSVFIFIAACAYSACNIILYTVNKEDQSAYTQQHES